jgi:hypothetical protein
MRIWSAGCAASKSTWRHARRPNVTALARGLIVLATWLIFATILGTATAAEPANGSSKSYADSVASAHPDLVILTKTEADSLYLAISELELQLKLVRIDLAEAKAYITIQDVVEKERSKLIKEYYVGIIHDLQPPWYRRLYEKVEPALWFALGGYLGASLAN